MSDEQFTMSDVWWGGMPAAAHHWRLAPHDSSLMYRHQQPATNTTLALSHQHLLTNVKGGSSRRGSAAVAAVAAVDVAGPLFEVGGHCGGGEEL